MYPKRPKIGLFFENFSLVVCLLCTPSNSPKTGGQIWGPSAFKTRQTVWEIGSAGSARSSAELPHDSLRDFEGASPAEKKTVGRQEEESIFGGQIRGGGCKL